MILISRWLECFANIAVEKMLLVLLEGDLKGIFEGAEFAAALMA